MIPQHIFKLVAITTILCTTILSTTTAYNFQNRGQHGPNPDGEVSTEAPAAATEGGAAPTDGAARSESPAAETEAAAAGGPTTPETREVEGVTGADAKLPFCDEIEPTTGAPEAAAAETTEAAAAADAGAEDGGKKGGKGHGHHGKKHRKKNWKKGKGKWKVFKNFVKTTMNLLDFFSGHHGGKRHGKDGKHGKGHGGRALVGEGAYTVAPCLRRTPA